MSVIAQEDTEELFDGRDHCLDTVLMEMSLFYYLVYPFSGLVDSAGELLHTP